MEAGDALQEREMGGERTGGEIPRTVRGDGRGREICESERRWERDRDRREREASG